MNPDQTVTYQMGDGAGGLAFLLLAFVSLVLFGILIFRAFGRTSVRWAAVSLICIWGLYASAIAVTGVASVERQTPLGSVECFDDWCASVTKTTALGNVVTLDVQVMNEAQRAAQTPDHPRLVLIDSTALSHPPTGQTPRPLTSRLEPGETFSTQLRFDISPGSLATKALLTEGSGPPLIGDQNTILHKKTFVNLQAPGPSN